MTQPDDWEPVNYHNLPHWMKRVSKPKEWVNKTYTKIFYSKPYDYKAQYNVVHGKLHTDYWRSRHQPDPIPPSETSSKRLKSYHYLLIFLILAGLCFFVITQFNPSINTSSPEISSPIIDTNSIIRAVMELSNRSTTSEDSKKYIDYINSIRASNGVQPIRFDSRVYNIAMARVNDMDKYGYMGHTNHQTGTCADNIKTLFGLSNSEYVAENAYGFSTGGSYSTGMEKKAVDVWMTSPLHRNNLLYRHSAGAIACSKGGHCVFLGLNNNRYGQGCY